MELSSSKSALVLALVLVAIVLIEANADQTGPNKDGEQQAMDASKTAPEVLKNTLNNPNSKDGFNYEPKFIDKLYTCQSVAIKGIDTNTVRNSTGPLKRFDEIGVDALEGESDGVKSVVMLVSRCRQCCADREKISPPYYLKTEEKYKFRSYEVPKIRCKCHKGGMGESNKFPRWYEIPQGKDTELHLKFVHDFDDDKPEIHRLKDDDVGEIRYYEAKFDDTSRRAKYVEIWNKRQQKWQNCMNALDDALDAAS